MNQPKRVIVEADGGSRGNPGPAAYGALLKDADTGELLAEDGTPIGRASNNVAEYRGLIAGLELARELAPEADIEVRMDSKLVVEQMSGRWKIKHPDMKPLATEANRLAPFGTTYTWMPREQNKHADRLANEALDGTRFGVTVHTDDRTDPESLIEEVESPAGPVETTQQEAAGYRGWSAPENPPTTLILVRHGVTPLTLDKRFSGGLASSNPGLSDDGKAQIREVADWLAPLAETVDLIIASPVRRTRESADILAERLGIGVVEEPGFAEMEFGSWDGLTFAEVAERDRAALGAWRGSLDVAPGGGESFHDVEKRVVAALSGIVTEHAGRTVIVVSHVTPIKTLVARAVDAPLTSVFRMELSPASVTVVSFFAGEADAELQGSLRRYNTLPPSAAALDDPYRW